MDTSGGSGALLERLTRLHPKVIDLSLGRMEGLLAKLGHPERNLPPVIHIAGTNGKGSTQAMLRAGLEAAGNRVHAYTSPHLVHFHERIRLAGDLISEEALAALLEECEAANGSEPITFFEVTTAAAFLGFSRTPAEMLLLEVGLGGRLDATNVVDRPALCVITPVSIDHQQFLGETLREIAFEKAGILKPGVTCVVGPQEDAAREVIEEVAAKVGAPLLIAGQDWQSFAERGRLVFQDDNGLLDLPLPNLFGPHQIENAGAAIAALRALGHDELAAEAAVTKAEWPARMQRLRSGPLVEMARPAELWLDGGHNAGAGQAVAGALAAMGAPAPTLVMGMLATKDAASYLRPLRAYCSRLVAVTIPGESAAMPAAEIVAIAQSVGFEASAAEDLPGAIRTAVGGGTGGRILICGSLYLAGKVLALNS